MSSDSTVVAAPRCATTRVTGKGEEVYRARDGRRIRCLHAKDVGNGLIRAAAPVRDLLLEDVTVEGAYRVIEDSAAEKGGDAGIHDLVVRRVQATGLRRGFSRIRYDSSGGQISDVRGEGIVATAPHDLPAGMAFADSAHDFRIERCIMRGFRWRRAEKKYWNGDGYSTERGNHDFLFRQCAAWDNSDGGFDLKSTRTLLDDCVAGRNARNYRLWDAIRATRLTSLDPSKFGGIGDTTHLALIGAKGKGKAPHTVEIEHLVVRSDRAWPIFTIYEGPVRIVIGSHDIAVPDQTRLVHLAGGAVVGGIVWKIGAPPGLKPV